MVSTSYHKTKSLYQQHAVPPAGLAVPQQSFSTDIAIIGGGFTGLSAALNLAERGYDVALFEAGDLGAGASGRNGGHLCQGWSTDFDKIARQLDPAHRQMAWQAGCEAVEEVAGRIDTHQIDCGLRWGYLHAALHKKQLDEALSMLDEYEAHHYPHMTALPDRQSVARHIDSPAYIGGVFDAGSGHLNPMQLLCGLADAALAAGAALYPQTKIIRTDYQGGKHQITIASGQQVSSRLLLYCGNAYLSEITPKPMQLRLARVSSSILATTPLDPALQTQLLPTMAAVADGNTALNYFRLDTEGRMIFGGRASYLNAEPSRLEPDLRRRMAAVFPALAHQPAEQVWTGTIGITVDRAPHFGRLENGAYFAQGYSGHGVALSNFTGRLMAEAIAGESERFDIFSRLKHLPFPGGPLRTPALALGMSWYKLRDWLHI